MLNLANRLPNCIICILSNIDMVNSMSDFLMDASFKVYHPIMK